MDTEELPDFLSEDHVVTPEMQDDPPAAPEAPSQDRAPEAAPAPAPAPATEAAAAPAPPQDGAPAPAPAAADTRPPGDQRDGPPVPLATFLDIRERMQRAERALADRHAQEANVPPDRNEDPEGYEQHQQANLQLVLFEQRRDLTRTVAEVRHGPEVVTAAFDWAADVCDRSPGFNRAVMTAPDPAAFVVGEYQRQQRDRALSDVSVDDIEAFRQWKASQGAGAPAPGAPAPQPAAAPAAQPTFRRSLASAPSAGAAAAPEGQDGGQVFEGMFGTG